MTEGVTLDSVEEKEDLHAGTVYKCMINPWHKVQITIGAHHYIGMYNYMYLYACIHV